MFLGNIGPQHEPCDSGLHRCAVSVCVCRGDVLENSGVLWKSWDESRIGSYNTGSIFGVEQDVMGAKAQELKNTLSYSPRLSWICTMVMGCHVLNPQPEGRGWNACLPHLVDQQVSREWQHTWRPYSVGWKGGGLGSDSLGCTLGQCC